VFVVSAEVEMLIILVLGLFLISLSVGVEHLLEVREGLEKLRVLLQLTFDEVARRPSAEAGKSVRCQANWFGLCK
jgi:hypothetical protein